MRLRVDSVKRIMALDSMQTTQSAPVKMGASSSTREATLQSGHILINGGGAHGQAPPRRPQMSHT